MIVKVYVLKENYPYEGDLIKGIFSSKEFAESIQKRLKEQDNYLNYSIEEHELDQEVD